MSRSPVSTEQAKEGDVLDRYADAVVEMGRKILEGQSFSGREQHCAYLNTEGLRFANISAVSGLDFPDDGRGMVTSDWDFDGDPDLWISNRTAPRLRFLRNDTTNSNHFAAFRLRGNGTTSNRDAIGSRLALRVGGVALLRTLRAGEGFLSQSSRWVHFGIGHEGAIESLSVRWPDGSEQTFSAIEPSRFYEIQQGADSLTVYTPPPRAKLTPSEVKLRPPTQQMRLRLAARAPLPRINYRDLEGRERRLREHLDKPLLLNLWASWCLPCLAELRELNTAGAHVLALSLDGIGAQSPTTHDDARRFWKENGYRLAAGFADEKVIELLQFYRQAMFLDRQPFPLPTSFLIDTNGAVGVIYTGPVGVAELERDIARLDEGLYERRDRAVPFAGRWRGEIANVSPTELARAFIAEDMLEEAMAYLEEFGSDHDNPMRPLVLMELSHKLRRRGYAEQADVIATAAKQIQERRNEKE